MEEARPKGFTDPTPAEAKPEKEEKEEKEEELLSEILSAGADNGDKEKTMSKQKLLAVDAKDALDKPWSATIVKFLAAHEGQFPLSAWVILELSKGSSSTYLHRVAHIGKRCLPTAIIPINNPHLTK
jgi:hypothetical protein